MDSAHIQGETLVSFLKAPYNAGMRILLIVLVSFFPALGIHADAEKRTEWIEFFKLFKEGNVTEAKNGLSALIKKHPDHAMAMFTLGKIFYYEGDHEKAIDWLEQSIERNKRHSESHLWLGRAFGMKTRSAFIFEKLALAGKIRGEFEKAVKCDGENMNARLALMQYYMMAPGFVGGSKKKGIAQAKEIGKRSLAYKFLAFGILHMFDKNFKQAEEYLMTFLESAKKSDQSLMVVAHVMLGMMYKKDGRTKAAKKAFEAVLHLQPYNHRVKKYLKDTE